MGSRATAAVTRGFATYDIATDTWTSPRKLALRRGAGRGDRPRHRRSSTPMASYGDDLFYRFNTVQDNWLFTLQFPQHHLNDGGMAYVSAKGLQGIYATYGQDEQRVHALRDAAPTERSSGARRRPPLPRRRPPRANPLSKREVVRPDTGGYLQRKCVTLRRRQGDERVEPLPLHGHHPVVHI